VKVLRRFREWLGEHIVLWIGIAVLVYMFIPIAVVIAMSFNVPPSRNVYQFGAFTWHNWAALCEPQGLCEALTRSIEIGLLATLGATVLGTLMAFALVRHRFTGRAAVSLFLFLPMASPEIVMGSSLLALFIAAGFGGELGFWTILIAHIMFCLSFVVVTVKARLAGMDSRLEEAAMDLYANEWHTFWLVTFPQVFPGILGAALLAFSLSFDDFIITNLNAGTTVTFPMFVWGSALRQIPMQVNVVGTLMFLLSLVVVLCGEWQRRRTARIGRR
jgi:spermidine/putrescine transport system permease protein